MNRRHRLHTLLTASPFAETIGQPTPTTVNIKTILTSPNGHTAGSGGS